MSVTTSPELRTLAQADLLLLLARLLTQPTDAAGADVTDEELHELGTIAGCGDASIRTSLIAAVHEARGLDRHTWAGEASRLFEGAVVCPINETAYVRRDKGAILADVCGFYQAFGYRLSSASGEKADHLVTELEFLALLLVMLTQARESGGAAGNDDEQVTVGALHAFAGEHLDEWLPLFCDRLQESTRLDLYRHVAACLTGVADAVLADHGVPRAERGLADFPLDDCGTPYECGKAACGAPSDTLDIKDAPS